MDGDEDSAADVADVVEQGGRRLFPSLNWRPPRGAAVLLAAGLVIGLAAGYAAGYRLSPRHVGLPAASPGSASPLPGPAPAPVQTFGAGTPTPTGRAGLVITGYPALIQDIGSCSVRSGLPRAR